MKKVVKGVLSLGLATGLVLATSMYNYTTKTQTVVVQEEVQETVKHVETLKQLDDIIADNKYVAVDLGATWCGPCRAYEPVFKAVAEKYKGEAVFAKVVLDEIDEKEGKKISNNYNVKWIPKTMFFKDGKEIAIDAKDKHRKDYNGISGSMSEEQLTKFVEKYLFDKE